LASRTSAPNSNSKHTTAPACLCIVFQGLKNWMKI
jgi:hypothetical protein